MQPVSLSRLAISAHCHLTHYQGWPCLHIATQPTIKADHICTLPPDSLSRLATSAQCFLTHYQGWPYLHNTT
ncbi:hypothetical protein DPMN_106663 [Dreissena polymorpha]|uniref:Uncharacterized protein n=1 Tax=Dreissena polymorpha TaxID=45954 RepID=A0A9D4K5G0_DREPO|nr:hypothetical protein DPMN_106650 [Dreissena polymorpha]KAH3833350.1 hypothetical protein DPMN_106657 [Dreissena polymorpha]KAH3833356.1 hypothetical protein DPMN_106663 [Dreissena polymorpha]